MYLFWNYDIIYKKHGGFILRLLFIGDVVGKHGCDFLSKKLFSIKKEYEIDVTVINGENSADGNGITKASLDMLTSYGADVITTGNHAFKRQDCAGFFNSSGHLLRPANYPESVCGRGVYILDTGMVQLAVINLMGVIFMEPLDNPFNKIDEILSEIKTPNIFVDFHAEATSEKKAMGHYLSGRVTAVMGTHTHVQTADETILSDHTAYITDVGMTGAENSVLGVKSEIIIEKLKNRFPVRFVESREPCFLNGIVIDFDEKLGKANKITRLILR